MSDSTYSRREFLKLAAGQSGSSGPPPASKAKAGAFVNFTGAILAGIPDCLEYRIAGFYVVYGKPYVIVQHFAPIGFIEVYKHVGGSVFFDAGTALTGTISEGITGFRSEGAYEARVWLLEQELVDALSLGVTRCLLCPTRVYKGPGAGNPDQLGRDIGGLDRGAGCSTVTDYFSRQVTDWITAAFGGQLILAYDTGLDYFNWHFGCRDQLAATLTGIPAMAACATGQNFTFRGMFGGRQYYDQACIGTWGPLLPRQMRFDASTNISAGAIAYRAVHIANRDLHSLPYSVHLGCKLQPVYPNLQPRCVFPGCSTTQADALMKRSSDGTYGYMWWVPVTCSKPLEDFLDCQRNGTPIPTGS